MLIIMNLSNEFNNIFEKSHKDEFGNLLEESHKHENYEYEIVFHKVNEEKFTRIFRYLKTISENEESIQANGMTQTLDISNQVDNVTTRLSINDLNSISKYCKNEKDLSTQYTLMTKTKIKSHQVLEFDFVLNVKREDLIKEQIKETIEDLRVKNKSYRLKKRFSFTFNNNFRVDMTILRSGVGDTMKKSQIFKAPLKYEIEVEYLKTNTSEFKKDELILELTELITLLWKLQNDTDTILSNEKKKKVSIELINLVCKIKYDNKIDLKNNPQKYFLSYQPVTLQLKHLKKSPDVGELSILSKKTIYSVTDKADGERHLLYVDKSKHLYLINNRHTVKYVGKTNKPGNTVIDGEFIKYNKDGILINRFMCFDIYFCNNEDVRTLPLITEDGRKSHRIGKLTTYVKDIETFKHVTIKIKRFYSIYNEDDKTLIKENNLKSNDLLKFCKLIYESSNQLDYAIDGLIFTPCDYSVGATYIGEDMERVYSEYTRIIENNKGIKQIVNLKHKWNRVFKWKPPKENTIDMLVKTTSNNFTKTMLGKQYVKVDLFVAGNFDKDSEIDPLQIFKDLHRNINTKYIGDNSIKFTELGCYLEIEDGNTYPLTKDYEPILNDTIVEFSYNADDKIDTPHRWIPNRIRRDKTELYLKKNIIGGAANHIDVAKDVMKSIAYPVTEDFIQGKKTPNLTTIVASDSYYVRNRDRKRMISYPMLLFHNHVKDTLYKSIKDKKSLLEIACGKGGDIYKLKSKDSKLKYVVGIDINVDNILNVSDGAYKRLDDMNKNTVMMNPKMIFTTLDATKEWEPNYVDNVENSKMRLLNKLLWDRLSFSDKTQLANNNLLLEFNGVMKNKFDVVSCQFAIHYFFESDQTLNNFCTNLNNYLNTNGLFIGTFLDGKKIVEMLNNKTHIHGHNKKYDDTIWSIRKKYNDVIDPDKIGTSKQIETFVESIGQTISEYLVDFELLKRKLEKYNIKLLTTENKSSLESFSQFYEEYLENKKTNKKNFELDDVMKKYSGLHMYFIFVKN